MKYVQYNEPREGRDTQGNEVTCDVTLRVTVEHAVAMQRHQCYKARGVDIYKSDEDALNDFVVVNWATLVD